MLEREDGELEATTASLIVPWCVVKPVRVRSVELAPGVQCQVRAVENPSRNSTSRRQVGVECSFKWFCIRGRRIVQCGGSTE